MTAQQPEQPTEHRPWREIIRPLAEVLAEAEADEPPRQSRRSGTGGNHSAAHSSLVTTVQAYLGWVPRHAWIYKVWGGPMSRCGVPDILCCIQGRLLGIECKSGRGRLSQAQQAERGALVAIGALFIEARHVEDVEQALAREGLVTPALQPAGRPSAPATTTERERTHS
jgi:hypothetical protein